MKIEFLDEFVKISRYLNYSMVAEQIHVSQSVLTRHIMQIEDEFNIRLLERNTQSVSLTEAGKVFLEYVIPVLDDYEKLKAQMQTLKDGYESTLQIGVPYYAMESYLDAVPENFALAYPKVKLGYRFSNINEMLRLVSEGKVDVAIAANFNYPEGGRLSFYHMFYERLGVLISSKHVLAKQRSISLGDLREEPFLTVNSDYSNNSWGLTEKLCREEGFSPTDPTCFNDFETAILAVKHQKGILVVGDHMKLLESERLAYRRLSNPGCVRRVGVWCRKGKENAMIKNFIKVCANTFQK